MTKPILRLVLLLLVVNGCTADSPGNKAGLAARVDSLATRSYQWQLTNFPETGTSLGIGGANHAGITDNSLAAIAKRQAEEDSLYAAVKGIDADELVGTDAEVTFAVLREQLESARAMRVCREELWSVASYVNGWQAVYTDLALLQPVGTDELRTAALARARALPRYLANEMDNLRAGLKQGYGSPKVIVQNVIGQLDGILGTPVTKSPFYSPAQRDSTKAFGAELARVIETELTPAIRAYRDFLQNTYLPATREALGVSANPNGIACYRATLRSFATRDMDPDSVFATGLAQMERVQQEMRTIATRSFEGESLETLLPKLRTDPRFTFKTSQEIIDTSSAIIARGKAKMASYFGILPKADLTIQPYPEFRQKAGAPGQYQPAPDDGSRPAIFLINPSEPTKKSRADAETTALHEGIPGHHLQIAIAKERTGLHPLLRISFNSGFGEGWALYAERLGDEMGLFSSDLTRLGMLGSEAFRAARMVIDAGIHVKGWTKAQAVEYLSSHTVLSAGIVEGEVNRYISWPGQAPSYMIGRTEILRLREAARAKFGDKFDIRTFHDRVLESGTVPLSFLDVKIERWLRS